MARLNAKGGKNGVRIDDATRAKIVAAYETNSAKRVGKMFGVHLQTVINIVRELGATVRKPYRRLPETWASK